MNSFERMVYEKAKKKDQELYENGVLPLIGSKLVTKVRTTHDKILAISALMLIIICMAPMQMAAGSMANASPFWVTIISFIARIYAICLLAVFLIDLDTMECYLFGYKKSNYALATGVNKKSIPKDKGLIGEYKGYVLSRGITVPHRVLHNVCVPMENGNYQEIDTISITSNIVYVLECKNRGGRFEGKYTDERWTQYIGSQVHECENIYIQNQKHTMALDQFLLRRGIIQNGDCVCINVVFSNADMKLPTQNVPLDFVFGNLNYIRNYINKNDRAFDNGTDTTSVMERIYEELLPYALYNEVERKNMLKEREARSINKEFTVGPFYEKTIAAGIPGVTQPGEAAHIRYNKIYTQVEVSNGKASCWQTRTDIPRSYCRREY